MRRTERTALKEHRCDFCYGPIAPGTRYIDGFWLCEGDPSPWKSHVDCQTLADWWADQSGEDAIPPFVEWLPDDDFDQAPEMRIEFDRLVARAGATASPNCDKES